MTSSLRTDNFCTFSNSMSCRASLTCDDIKCLTPCHLDFVSFSEPPRDVRRLHFLGTAQGASRPPWSGKSCADLAFERCPGRARSVGACRGRPRFSFGAASPFGNVVVEVGRSLVLLREPWIVASSTCRKVLLLTRLPAIRTPTMVFVLERERWSGWKWCIGGVRVSTSRRRTRRCASGFRARDNERQRRA